MDKISAECKKPVFCDLIVTESCILRCMMCKMWQNRDNPGMLRAGAWKRFIDSFAGFVDSRAQVQFVGGEPLLKEGILDLIALASQKGLHTTMTTSAFLINDEMAHKIVNSGLNTLVLSLDAIDEEIHDYLRGVKGVYAKLMNAVECLKRIKGNSLKVHIVTTIMRINLDEIVKLSGWVMANESLDGISFQAVMEPFFTKPDKEWYKRQEYSFLWPRDIDKVNSVMNELIRLKKVNNKINNPAAQFEAFKSYFKTPGKFIKNKKCNLGYNSISVDPYGRVFLCQSMQAIGNIGRDSIHDIWFSEKAGEVRNGIMNCKDNCKLMINCFFEKEE